MGETKICGLCEKEAEVLAPYEGMTICEPCYEETFDLSTATSDQIAGRIAWLDSKKKVLDSEVKDISATRTELERVLLDKWSDTGSSSTKVNGRTVHIRRELNISRVDSEGEETTMEEVVAAIRESNDEGLLSLISESYNYQSFRSHINELAANMEAESGEAPDVSEVYAVLPEPVRKVLSIGEKFSIRSRK